jgi:hypothetical protein
LHRYGHFCSSSSSSSSSSNRTALRFTTLPTRGFCAGATSHAARMHMSQGAQGGRAQDMPYMHLQAAAAAVVA